MTQATTNTPLVDHTLGGDGAVASTASGIGPRRRSEPANPVLALAKLGIVKMVALTAVLGFALAIVTQGELVVAGLVSKAVAGVAMLLGVSLAAGGANALNQVVEAARDAKMERTKNRPIASGRMSQTVGLLIGSLWSVLGVAVLWLVTSPDAAILTLGTILAYVFVYTPMKVVTPFATWVGTLPGAMPPVIGWAAAHDPAVAGAWPSLTPSDSMWGIWAFVVLMAVWQVPHFAAIAWKYRDDYGRGGFKVLSVVDPTGRRAAGSATVWAGALVPLSLFPAAFFHETLTGLYVLTALAASVWMFKAALEFAEHRTNAYARRLFVASLIYLPVVMLAMVVDIAIHAFA